MLRPCLSAGGEEGGAVVDQKGEWGIDFVIDNVKK